MIVVLGKTFNAMKLKKITHITFEYIKNKENHIFLLLPKMQTKRWLNIFFFRCLLLYKKVSHYIKK
jgi:hypothetical protein